jgi:single-stranded-DNA-specific exonuclease
LHPVLRRVYAARGVCGRDELDLRLADLLAPHALRGIDRACALLAEAIGNRTRILVVGDFDCDGATGTAVAVRGLRLLGATAVDYAVPNRLRHGYGLSPALVAELQPRAPQLLLTVDNGIAAQAGVAAAKALGSAVIVTDHHLPPAVLPAADAIVNPNLCGDGFPSKAIAGVGVMFYVLIALRARLREQGAFAARGMVEPDLGALLDLVALGTVADLVPLDRNNRILVEAGLKRIRSGRACAGIQALFAVAGRDPSRAVASDLGFAIAPRINAAGRLEDMRLGIECLLCDEPARARTLAETLSAINDERRQMQADMVAQAHAAVRRWTDRHDAAALPHGAVLFDPDWHPGVVGLVASKLKEALHRPVIACAPAEGDEIKGSGRSIEGFHLRDALATIDARHPGLLSRFGGHAMAAGLSLRRAELARFRAAFDTVARERLAAEQLEAVLHSDGPLEPADFTLDLARQVRVGGPWGQGFPEPLFDGEFVVAACRPLGERHRRLRLRHEGRAEPLDAVWFEVPADWEPPPRIRAAYQLDIDTWNGAEALRLVLRHVEPA